jgi:sugar/nucleoside kinase (ribokinase family)/phosphoglycolate phosphatase-like HAD superfamily hydrolase
MKVEDIKNLLEKIKKVRIAVYGDFCLDAYWILDPRGSEVSLETGLQANAVGKQNYSLGGASNIVANLTALEPAAIKIFGVAGADIFAREMIQQLQSLGVDTTGLIIQKDEFDTYTFCKHYLESEEQPRYDFGFYNVRSWATDRAILKKLRQAVSDIDIVILNQQVPGSITNRQFITELNELIESLPSKIFLLSEAARLNGVSAAPDDVFSLSDIKKFAKNLFKIHKKPVFISRGSRGILACDKKGFYEVPGIQILKKIDPVGAGDTTLSAIACALAAAAGTGQVIEFANYAAAVTVQKLYQTGTANGSEILQTGSDADYIYQPELAEDFRQAKYFKNSEIEICCNLNSLKRGRIKHAVFDHDGTISALREGWETVMEPVMIKAILGDHYVIAEERVYRKVVYRVRDYIDKSTGVQTIVQMEGLIEIIKEFGFVPADKILDKFGYKEIYNKALMTMVNKRKAKLKSGQLEVSDFAIKGAIQFLHALRKKGITLYLASGTDVTDVKAEAKVLGYHKLFNGGIYGSLGDINKYSKKMVINNIIQSNILEGHEMVTLGDGPVEMRECRKKDGIAIGIASDEVRRHGLNMEKRMRLIKAGAHFVTPDFSNYKCLLDILLD